MKQASKVYNMCLKCNVRDTGITHMAWELKKVTGSDIIIINLNSLYLNNLRLYIIINLF